MADPDLPAEQTSPDWSYSGELVRLLGPLAALTVSPLSRPGHVFQRSAPPSPLRTAVRQDRRCSIRRAAQAAPLSRLRAPQAVRAARASTQALKLRVIGGLEGAPSEPGRRRSGRPCGRGAPPAWGTGAPAQSLASLSPGKCGDHATAVRHGQNVASLCGQPDRGTAPPGGARRGRDRIARPQDAEAATARRSPDRRASRPRPRRRCGWPRTERAGPRPPPPRRRRG